MDRLTGWDKGNPYVRKCLERQEGGCRDMDTKKCLWCQYNLETLRRLAQYEDAGLTPDEIKSLQEALGGKEVANWAIEAVECRKEAANANLDRIKLRAQLEGTKAVLAGTKTALADTQAALAEAVAALGEIKSKCIVGYAPLINDSVSVTKAFTDIEELCNKALQSPATKATGERWRAMERCADLLKKLHDRNMRVSLFMGLQEEQAVHDALQTLEGIKLEGVKKVKICPDCGSLAYWDSYFQTYVCSLTRCFWKESEAEEIHRE